MKEKSLVAKVNTRTTTVLKRQSLTKTSENESKILIETNAAKTNADTKNVNTPRSNRIQQITVTRSKTTESNVNNENSIDGVLKKNNDTKKDLETVKNQMNTSLNKTYAINGLR